MASRYSQLRVLGRGAYGTALLVRDAEGAQPLRVLKEVDLTQMSEEKRREAHKEVDVLKSLHHTNIVAYCDTFVEASHLCIVMEYADGGTLAESLACRRQVAGHFSEGEALNIFSQCCSALRHIHDRHILHRDLKSQNVFLTESGKVKLGDFGIAKLLEDTSAYAKTVIGTPSYLAPEVCDNRPYGMKADIWSLGVVLYEMLTLDLPFKARSLAALVVKIVTKKVPPINPSFCSDEACQLVMHLLRKNPRKRLSIDEILALPIMLHTMEVLDGKKFLSDSDASTRATSRNASTDSSASRKCTHCYSNDLKTFVEDTVAHTQRRQSKNQHPSREGSLEDTKQVQRGTAEHSDELRVLRQACQIDTSLAKAGYNRLTSTNDSSDSSAENTSEEESDERNDETLNPWEGKAKAELPALRSVGSWSAVGRQARCRYPSPVCKDLRHRLVPIPLHDKRHSAPPFANPSRVSAVDRRVQKPPKASDDNSDNLRLVLMAQGLPSRERRHSLPAMIDPPRDLPEHQGVRPSSQPAVRPPRKCRNRQQAPLALAGRMIV